MAHLGLVHQRELVLIDFLVAESGDRQRRDEIGPAPAQHAPYRRAALAQPADQDQALVGSYAARDDEQDSFAGKHRMPVFYGFLM